MYLKSEALLALVGGSFRVDVFRKGEFLAEKDSFLHFSNCNLKIYDHQ